MTPIAVQSKQTLATSRCQVCLRQLDHIVLPVIADAVAIAACSKLSLSELEKNSNQNRRQNFINRGLYVCAGGALRSCRGGRHSNLAKIPLIFCVSCFKFGGLGVLFGEAKPTKVPPWRRDWFGLFLQLDLINSIPGQIQNGVRLI